MAVNIINPEAIQQYLAEQAGGDVQVAAWLEAALLKLLKKREESAVELKELPADAPAWLQNKWDICGGSFHKFEPDAGLTEPVRHIADWLVSAKLNGEEIVVRDLQNLTTLENLTAAADRYFTKLNKNLAGTVENDGDIRTVMTFDDGSKIVQLLTPNALKVEGPAMGHCIGGGKYDQSLLDGRGIFYSLRDAENNPHATFEVEVKGNILRQCKGKGNRPPVQKYMPAVQEFVMQQKFKLEEAAANTGLIQGDDGAYHSIYALPENLSVFNLNLSGCVSLTSLPEHLSVGGYLSLNCCPNLASLPENLSVGGALMILDCGSLTSLPENLSVGGSLSLNNYTGLRSIPRSMKCGDTIVTTHLGLFHTVAEAADAFEAKYGKPKPSTPQKLSADRPGV